MYQGILILKPNRKMYYICHIHPHHIQELMLLSKNLWKNSHKDRPFSNTGRRYDCIARIIGVRFICDLFSYVITLLFPFLNSSWIQQEEEWRPTVWNFLLMGLRDNIAGGIFAFHINDSNSTPPPFMVPQSLPTVIPEHRANCKHW